jgi:hypothetical protein
MGLSLALSFYLAKKKGFIDFKINIIYVNFLVNR